MSGINFIGSYSGIDKTSIDQLMEAERLPLKQFQIKKSSIAQKQNAWKDINTRLNNLFNKLKALQTKDTFTSKTATSTNEDIVAISPSKNAVEGSYKIQVKQLATNTTIIGRKIDNGIFNEDGKFTTAGLFVIKNQDGKEYEIEYTTDDDLKSLVDKINAKTKAHLDPNNNEEIDGSGISATIIDGRLVLTDIETGNRNIELSDSIEGTLDRLGLKNIEKDDDTESRIIQGRKAIFTINNVEVEKDSNTISDVIEGLTINLKKASEGQEITVTVGINYGKAEKAIQEFVDQYNSTISFIEEKLAAGDPDVPGSAGVLVGDGTLMRLHSSLRNLVTSSVFDKGYDGFKDISQLGVTTVDKYGRLQFDSTKFREALEKDPDKVMEFFFGKGEGEDKVDGFVDRLNSYIDSFISTKNGIIKSKNESYDKILKDINRQIEIFNERMERKEQQYIKIFTALDVAMMQAESQMNWLVGQIDMLNASYKK